VGLLALVEEQDWRFEQQAIELLRHKGGTLHQG